MISKWTIVFTCTLLAFSEANYVETIKKCEMDDTVCFKEYLETFVKDKAESGYPEYNMIQFDPLLLKDQKFEVSLPGFMNMTIVDGELKGIKQCVFSDIVSELKKGFFGLKLTCNLDIDAYVEFKGITPIVQNFVAIKDVTEGTAKANVKLINLHVYLKYYYDLIKKADGDIYFKCRKEESQYKYDVDSVKIVADKVLFGKKDLTKPINELFEKNSEFVWNTFAHNFFDVAIAKMNTLVEVFFEKTPTKYIISTDLSPYVKN